MLPRRTILTGLLGAVFWPAMSAQAASWVDLGIRQVSLAKDVDRIDVVASRRFFAKLRLAVTGNAVFLRTLTVHFANGSVATYRFDALIAEGGRSGSIDLPGDARRIQHVGLTYRRAPGGGIAVVTLQGLPN